MKLTHLEVQENKNHIKVTYTFELELLKTPFYNRVFGWKKRKKEDAQEKLKEFEEILDSMYKGEYKHKTTLVGEYIEIKETNQRETTTAPNQSYEGQKLPKNTLCSIIRHDFKKNKRVITIINKGNYVQKLGTFNDELKQRNIPISKKAETQIEYLDTLLKKYS